MRTVSSLKNWGILSEPVLKVLELSLTVVVNTRLFVLWVEDKSWVASDFNALGLVGGGIEFGNDDVLVIFVMLGKLIPDWSEFLTVTAPWGIVLNEYILGLIHDDLIEVLSNNDGESLTCVVNWLL